MPGRSLPTHRYPDGKPLPLRVLDGLGFVAVVAWLFCAFKGWFYAVAIIAVAFAIVIASRKLNEKYEHLGKAERIRYPQVTRRFVGGTPKPLIALRLGFFAGILGMILFAVAPLSFTTAKDGIIGCVLCLVAIGASHVLLEHRYLRVGRAVDEEFPSITE